MFLRKYEQKVVYWDRLKNYIILMTSFILLLSASLQ